MVQQTKHVELYILEKYVSLVLPKNREIFQKLAKMVMSIYVGEAQKGQIWELWSAWLKTPTSIFLFESYRICDFFLFYSFLSQAVFTCSRGDKIHGQLRLQTMLHIFWQFWSKSVSSIKLQYYIFQAGCEALEMDIYNIYM